MKAFFVSKRIEAEEVKTFVFRPEKKYFFIAGQFAFFSFKTGGKSFSKHFTISGSPLRPMIEMTTILSGSDYKNALDSLKEGDVVELSAPMGDFTLQKAGEKKIVFLAGGIGITPVRSILENLEDIGKDREIFLFYSNRTEKKIAFRSELTELQKKISGLRIVHTLTDLNAQEKENWKGENGFIGSEMIKKHFSEVKNAVFFVVGPPRFNEAMEKMLKVELKVLGKDIVLENFSGY